MDHLAPVVNPYQPIAVPYLGREYDGFDFYAYPDRCAQNVALLQNGAMNGSDRAEAAAFLQTWLFFGMLREFLDVPLKTDDFVTAENTLTTEKLRSYLDRWKLDFEREQRDNEPRRAARLLSNRVNRYRMLFRESYKTWRGFNPSSSTCLIDPRISLSIQILGSTLEHSVSWPDFIDIDAPYQPWRFSDNTWLTDRMVRAGWCPTICSELGERGHFALLYYSSLLGQPYNGFLPEHIREEDAHANCVRRSTACVARNIDESVYRTRHVTADCQCRFLAVDYDQLCRIIDDGDGGENSEDEPGVALLAWNRGEQIDELNLVKYNGEVQYTAISHVWADGMGNPRANSLPTCQVRRLQQWLEALPLNRDASTCYMWLDTLHVPVFPAHARNSAVTTMAKVYTSATATLIVDGSLLRVPAGPARYEEIFARISATGWLRRLWTLQEGLFSTQPLAQFADAAVDISAGGALSAAQAAQQDHTADFCNEIGWHCDQFDFSFAAWARRGWTPAERAYKVLRQLAQRSTTRAADEALCLATLLELPRAQLRALQAVPGADARRAAFWRALRQVPACVLFLPGHKSPLHNFGWSPASLLACGWMGNPGPGVVATVAPDGALLACLPGFEVAPLQRDRDAVLAVRLRGEVFYVRRNVKYGGPDWGEDLGLARRGRLAVVLGLPGPAMRVPPGEPPMLVACVGSLVEILDDDGDGDRGLSDGVDRVDAAEEATKRLNAKCLRTVSVIKRGSRWDENADPPWSEVEVEEKQSGLLDAQWFSNTQTWRFI